MLTDAQHLIVCTFWNVPRSVGSGRIHMEGEELYAMKLFLSSRYNQSQWYPVNGAFAQQSQNDE